MIQLTLKRAATALVTALLLSSLGTTTALAAGDDARTDGDVVELGSRDVRVADATVHVEGVHLTADGLPEKRVDDATLTLDGETIIDGATLSVDDRTYRIGRITLTVEDVGVIVDHVSIGDTA